MLIAGETPRRTPYLCGAPVFEAKQQVAGLVRTADSDNRAIATQEIINELIRLAKEMREATKRGEQLGLNKDEICFYARSPST